MSHRLALLSTTLLAVSATLVGCVTLVPVAASGATKIAAVTQAKIAGALVGSGQLSPPAWIQGSWEGGAGAARVGYRFTTDDVLQSNSGAPEISLKKLQLPAGITLKEVTESENEYAFSSAYGEALSAVYHFKKRDAQSLDLSLQVVGSDGKSTTAPGSMTLGKK